MTGSNARNSARRRLLGQWARLSGGGPLAGRARGAPSGGRVRPFRRVGRASAHSCPFTSHQRQRSLSLQLATGDPRKRSIRAGSRRTARAVPPLQQLEDDVAAAAHDPGADLDQLLAQCGHDQCAASFRNARLLPGDPSLEELLFIRAFERRVQLWRRSGEYWLVQDLIGEGSTPGEHRDRQSRSARSTRTCLLRRPATRAGERGASPICSSCALIWALGARRTMSRHRAHSPPTPRAP